MAFTRWVRSVSEKHLMVAAQNTVADRYGTPRPHVGRGPSVLFWQKVYVPLYHRLPARLRDAVVQRMPGSHRQQWTASPRARGPAV